VVLTLKRDEVAEMLVIFKVCDHFLPEFEFFGSNEALRVAEDIQAMLCAR
jgi:hypothetical protein